MGLLSAVGLPESWPYEIDKSAPNEFVIDIVNGPVTEGTSDSRRTAIGMVAVGYNAPPLAVPTTPGVIRPSWAMAVDTNIKVEIREAVRIFILHNVGDI